MVDYINKGIRQANRDFGIKCNIRVDLVRNYGPKIGLKILELIQSSGDNIVAIDTGGIEDGVPPKTYESVYKAAFEMGLHLVAHQGEAADVGYVWECIDYLNPERIGHGIAPARDPTLLKELFKRGISIESCPISNIRTGIINKLENHPIRKFIDAGVKVSVNTDDPSMFGTDMMYEYMQLHKKLGFTVSELYQISLDSIETSFMNEEEKNRLTKQYNTEYEKLT